jgi:transposase
MPGGAPTKRTAKNREAILDALSKGYTRLASAGAGGMTYQTFREWEKDDAEFSDAVEKAEGIAVRRFLGEIAQDKSWQAKAWILERRWPKEFGRRESVEMSGPDGGPIDHRDVSSLPDHEKRALVEAIRDHLASRRAGAGTPSVAGGGTPD